MFFPCLTFPHLLIILNPAPLFGCFWPLSTHSMVVLYPSPFCCTWPLSTTIWLSLTFIHPHIVVLGLFGCCWTLLTSSWDYPALPKFVWKIKWKFKNPAAPLPPPLTSPHFPYPSPPPPNPGKKIKNNFKNQKKNLEPISGPRWICVQGQIGPVVLPWWWDIHAYTFTYRDYYFCWNT